MILDFVQGTLKHCDYYCRLAYGREKLVFLLVQRYHCTNPEGNCSQKTIGALDPRFLARLPNFVRVCVMNFRAGLLFVMAARVAVLR